MARGLLFSRAENEAIRQEMERDATVVLLGEDVAGGAGRADQGVIDAWGGPMGATKGLIQQFGPSRVIDTPICEMGFIGAAVGAAVTGLRPVAGAVPLPHAARGGGKTKRLRSRAARGQCRLAAGPGTGAISRRWKRFRLSSGEASRSRLGSPQMSDHLDKLCIDTIRTLSMDAVEKAKSGHPGTPMALAPLMYTLWQNHLRYDPHNPLWPGRDRFVLSAGHASMLLYSALFLAQVRQTDANGNPTDKPAVSIEEIERFRQIGSKTPGHPEYGLTSGVELTTGPLGQGIGMSVGLAIAANWRAQHFNRPNFNLFDYRIWAICSDGDLMEGISNEAASIAGHLHLSNLVWMYDQNHISIEGSTTITFDEDVATRFQGYGWGVLHVADANDTAAIDEALSVAAAAKGSARPPRRSSRRRIR